MSVLPKILNLISIVLACFIIIGAIFYLANAYKGVRDGGARFILFMQYFFIILLGTIILVQELVSIAVVSSEFAFLRHWAGRGIFGVTLGFFVMQTTGFGLACGIIVVVLSAVLGSFAFLKLEIPPPILSGQNSNTSYSHVDPLTNEQQKQYA
eukprot:TRINITY_DN312_c0_g1_i1.p1 TRINITY_DN312_c0_g1~~TRINITY_DN312_c0_g1_i1.p1  ORF type:complete len:153 (-),score=71.49 TRINITY_DN312_c0_g1_i1:152-610(-)